MTTIYQIGANGLWTGASAEIDDAAGSPIGWTRAAPPTLGQGKFALWVGGWIIVSDIPAPPPPPFPPVEPEISIPTPVLYAAAQIRVEGSDITGIGINSRFAAAFWADVGKYYVFFLDPLPDTSYMVMATAGPCNAYVLEEDKATDFFVITVTNAAGEPSDASSVNISIVRAM